MADDVLLSRKLLAVEDPEAAAVLDQYDADRRATAATTTPPPAAAVENAAPEVGAAQQGTGLSQGDWEKLPDREQAARLGELLEGQ